MTKVYVVEIIYHYNGSEIDSIWSTEDLAAKRVYDLNLRYYPNGKYPNSMTDIEYHEHEVDAD